MSLAYDQLPSVDILIAVRNEERYIRDCLHSFYSADYPIEKFKIYVIDGCSSDRTVEVVNQFSAKYQNVFIIQNPRITVPYALNLGIKKSDSEIIFWASGHGCYDSNYLSECVSKLIEFRAASVGGLVVPIGQGFWGKAIAQSLKSPLGMGFASYRSSQEPMWVDTVMGGCWRRTDVEKINGFDENWTRNQDSEFNVRLKQSIGKILLIPSIKCRLFVRERLTDLMKQYFQYGFWRRKTVVRHPKSVKLRQLIPPTFIIILLILIIIDLRLFYSVVFVYFIASLLAVFFSQDKSDWLSKVAMLVVFPVIHVSWGIGFLRGLTSHVIKK